MVGKDFWRPPGPTPLLKLGLLEQVAQDYVQAAFENLQRGRLHNLSGQFMSVLCHTLNYKKCFLRFRRNFLCFSWLPLPLEGISTEPTYLVQGIFKKTESFTNIWIWNMSPSENSLHTKQLYLQLLSLLLHAITDTIHM